MYKKFSLTKLNIYASFNYAFIVNRLFKFSILLFTLKYILGKVIFSMLSTTLS